MAEDSDLERTEEATPQRIQKAREEGQVARSQELTTFTLLLTAAAGLVLMGGNLIEHLSSIMREGMQMERDMAFQTDRMINRLYLLAIESLWSLAPILVLLIIAAFFSPMLLSGWLLSTKALIPDFKRLNPVSGFGRIFSMHGLTELLKAIAKTVVVGSVAALVIWGNKDSVLALIAIPVNSGVTRTGELLVLSFLLITGAMILIVAIDVPFQLWSHAKKLRMTKEEIRREAKESEGDPLVKGRIRSLQREAARRRMMSEVPEADVIVTNPTHYAVALRYKSNSMGAPKVVAKGVHLLAVRIRELGETHHVPILEAPPLARALYHHAELDAEIPEKLYTAVAEVLAYVFQLKRYQDYGGDRPKPLGEISVPHELEVPETDNVE
ncbi:flagellar biosynthesis protein FlhB [Nitrosomonas sp.]|uniref:flagellar biosynthesis protein FlhB n=1 Tax=Nitrosomonas sp. TaxID=42353 RepID=UPI001DFAC1EF|nr:flagellar biosynthesis protein FlhB [Nitrosomonas sp.]MCB1947622.1 flagellar type III secretion system protein FlhB [Nitrosomonas sp.]MCP5242244.1 flagellar type III secretion system protein FlhB [Burkholderiales bacterium]MDR4514174.1 flagellar type III secretion system protein FlhB [Nitrosomonas sp.]